MGSSKAMCDGPQPVRKVPSPSGAISVVLAIFTVLEPGTLAAKLASLMNGIKLVAEELGAGGFVVARATAGAEATGAAAAVVVTCAAGTGAGVAPLSAGVGTGAIVGAVGSVETAMTSSQVFRVPTAGSKPKNPFVHEALPTTFF